jgi:hypothetical protein
MADASTEQQERNLEKVRGVRSAFVLGASAGVLAGIGFAIVQVTGSAMMGEEALLPFKFSASILMGRSAVEGASLVGILLVGLIVLLALSALYGAVYGVLIDRTGPFWRGHWRGQTIAGPLFGTALWAVNYHLLAPLLYPWFLTTHDFVQWVLHAFFFGLPLGWLYRSLGLPPETLRKPTFRSA